MLFIQSTNVDPHFNLALEQYVFDRLDRTREYCMLWQNDNTIVIGKHQNTLLEIDAGYVKSHGISVVRRLSGGGAVYHDMGNVNYTFIVDCGDGADFDFSTFCAPVVAALASMGVKAEAQGRNDITIDGMKFSGSAQYKKDGRVMHHGTIMFDSDLGVMRRALAGPKDMVDSKGVKSTKSMVTNVRPYLQQDMNISEFIDALRGYLFTMNKMEAYELNGDDIKGVMELKSAVYDTWEWNYGHSPEYSVVKERRVDGCGKIQIYMDVAGGRIRDVAFYGDYFGDGDARDLRMLMIGGRPEEDDLRIALGGVDIGRYFFKMDIDTFISIITQ